MQRLVSSGAEIDRAKPGKIDRHHHLSAYAALVLRGSYIEAGDRGRIRAAAGDVLFHHVFEGHGDWISSRGAHILNLPVDGPPAYASGYCRDADAIVRIAERDPVAAGRALLTMTVEKPLCLLDWPDQLAMDIANGRVSRFDVWAEEMGVRPQSLSRAFRLAYGITPQRFRFEHKSAAAARLLGDITLPLASIAAQSGFADQAHMNRSLQSLYGFSPGRWRAARVHCVQD